MQGSAFCWVVFQQACGGRGQFYIGGCLDPSAGECLVHFIWKVEDCHGTGMAQAKQQWPPVVDGAEDA